MLPVVPVHIWTAALKKIPQPLDVLVNTSLVEPAPAPRSVMPLLFSVIDDDRVNVPAPSSTYCPLGQALIAALMVALLPLYAAIVDPHRVVRLTIDAPAVRHSVAR
jgi:hypothetical protein